MLYTIALINILCVIGFCIKKRYYDNLVVSLPNWNIIFLQAVNIGYFLISLFWETPRFLTPIYKEISVLFFEKCRNISSRYKTRENVLKHSLSST